jgi:hypothetical protein
MLLRLKSFIINICNNDIYKYIYNVLKITYISNFIIFAYG